MFSVTGLPPGLKVSYWIWLIGGMLGVLGGVIGIFGALALSHHGHRHWPALSCLLVLVALALGRRLDSLRPENEGKARSGPALALTIVAGVSLVLAVISGSLGEGHRQ